jgi:hypothetical protein
MMGRAFALFLLWTVPAFAQEDAYDELSPVGQGWSLLSGKPLGNADSAVLGEAGWPGLSVSFLHGMTPKLDLGVRFTFNYGVEGMLGASAPGLKLQGQLRVGLVDALRFNLALTFAPGLFFYFLPTSTTDVGIALPAGLVVGFPVGSTLMIHAGIELPVFVVFGTRGGLIFPATVGAGAEYFIDRRLALSLSTKMGPVISGAPGQFLLSVLLGVAYKL